jgi:hypothetical protein
MTVLIAEVFIKGTTTQVPPDAALAAALMTVPRCRCIPGWNRVWSRKQSSILLSECLK